MSSRTKRIWAIQRDSQGVSPVIATILMVAITVVLAAVLYVMVFQLGGGPPPNPPAGIWNDVGANSQTEGDLVFGQFSYRVERLDIKLLIKANGTEIGEISFLSNTGESPQELSWNNAPMGATASFYDYNAAGGSINQGDYITLSGLSPRTTYSITVFHLDTESIAEMSGANPSFTTP